MALEFCYNKCLFDN